MTLIINKDWNTNWDPEKEQLYKTLMSNLVVYPVKLENARSVVHGVLTKADIPRIMVNESGHIPSWNSSPNFYKSEFEKQNRRSIFAYNLGVIGDIDGFSSQLAAMMDQPKETLTSFDKFTVFDLSAESVEEMMNSQEYKRDGMIWNVAKPGHAIIMKKDEYDKVVDKIGLYPAIMYPAADCIVTTVEDPDNGFVSILHTGYKEVASGMPYAFFKYLENKCGTNLSHLKISIGPAAWEGQVFSDEKLPSEIKQSEIWLPEFTISKDGKNEIKTGKAYFNQLINAFGGVEIINPTNITVDSRNTLFEDGLFTNAGKYLRMDTKDGRNLYVGHYPMPDKGTVKKLGTMPNNGNIIR